jgi:hypothetical protein
MCLLHLLTTGLMVSALFAPAVGTDYEVTFPLGTTEELTSHYSYPNSKASEQTLEDTLENYLNQIVKRDLVDNGLVTVDSKNDLFSATIYGDSEHVNKYKNLILKFHENGKLAVTAVQNLRSDGKWNEGEWRMFLPLGLAISNHRSVQLLHFPPDYSLPAQDYLGSKTSQRWEDLLEANGVPLEEVTLYESILDIAPIAAPSNAGSQLKHTYSYFENYVVQMLDLLLLSDEGEPRHMVAYGGPVRQWVKTYFNLQDYFGVNSIAKITVSGVSVPVLGANHPSYIWYAKNDGRQQAFEVMQQDLISACWQAKMGSDNSAAILRQCQGFWEDESNAMTVCIHMEIQAYGRSKTEAINKCKEEYSSQTQKTEL